MKKTKANILKIFFSICFLFLTCIKTQGQNFTAGIIGGFTTSQVSGDMLAGYNKSGFELGGFVGAPLSQKISMAFQIVYIQKGSKKPVRYDIGDFKYYRMSLNYIEVPFLIRYHFSDKIHFEGGPALGRLVSSKEEDEAGELLVSKEFKDYELSFMLGMSYRLFPDFYINLQGSNSLLPIREPPVAGGYYLNRGQFNSVLMLSFKYFFKKSAGEGQ